MQVNLSIAILWILSALMLDGRAKKWMIQTVDRLNYKDREPLYDPVYEWLYYYFGKYELHNKRFIYDFVNSWYSAAAIYHGLFYDLYFPHLLMTVGWMYLIRIAFYCSTITPHSRKETTPLWCLKHDNWISWIWCKINFGSGFDNIFSGHAGTSLLVICHFHWTHAVPFYCIVVMSIVTIVNYLGGILSKCHYTVDYLVAIPTCIGLYALYFHLFMQELKV